MKRVQRHASGSVRYDKRRKTWNYLWYDGGTRRSKRIGTKQEFPTKAAAWKAAEFAHASLKQPTNEANAPLVQTLIEQYRAEEMPQRYSTRRSYDVWLRLYVQPRWGISAITELQARPVELWLQTLDLAPRSKASIRFMIGLLWDFAMWRGDLPTGRNPMSLVTIPGATKRTRKP